MSENPGFTGNLRYLTAALSELGQVDEARQCARAMLAREPGFRLSVWEATRQPFQDPALKARYIGALRKVGLPQ